MMEILVFALVAGFKIYSRKRSSYPSRIRFSRWMFKL